MRARSLSLTAVLGALLAYGAILPLGLTAPAALLSAENETADRLKSSFSDTRGHWAEAEINALSRRGTIKGFPDGSFRPNAPVTRAEFAAMVNNAFSDGTSGCNRPPFPDTEVHWARIPICRASVRGFFSGYPDGRFQPEKNITRAEAIVALVNGIKLEGRTDLNSVYSDAGEIPPWASENVSRATYNGIRIKVPNADGQFNPIPFNPMQPASRADIAVFVYQALQRYPIAGVITHLDPPGGSITLNPPDSNTRDREVFAVRGAEMRQNTQVLRVPARAMANIGFRPAIGSGTISQSDYLVQAGPTAGSSEYQYPCTGLQGRFVMGWTAGSRSGCPSVQLGRTLVLPTVHHSSTAVALHKQVGQALGPILVAPATTATTWVRVDVSETVIEVTVLGGAVTVGPESDPQPVSALQRYTLRRDGSGRYQGQLTSLSEGDRLAIANAAEVNAFLDPSRWTPDIVSQLPQYRLYREELVAAVPPDPAVQAIDFSLLNRTSQFSGRVQVVGTVTNIGGPYRSRPGQQQVQLYETPLGGRSQLVARQDFQNLAPGETIRVVYERDWDRSSPAEGEFPPNYQVVISYDPDIALDGNPGNDDSNLQNNRLERSGADINGLFN